ncbi:hypothetical protein [Vibrio sp. TRT 29B02]|uniref:hypothetical protein n=1 Tax=Vibrio sp. TRT 29B02 TaxID=3418508 RepID=UPI003CF37C50
MSKVFAVKKLDGSIEVSVFESQKKFSAEHSWVDNDFTEVLLSKHADINARYATNHALAEAIDLAAPSPRSPDSFRVHIGFTALEHLTLVLLFRKLLSEKGSYAKMEVLESVPVELFSNEGYLELIKEREQRVTKKTRQKGLQAADDSQQQNLPLDTAKLVNALESELAEIKVQQSDAMKRNAPLEAVEHSCEVKAYTKLLRLIRTGQFHVTE